MMPSILRTTVITVAAALLTACGGGGSSTQPSTPASSPTPAATSTLKTAQLNGAAGFTNPAGHTVYIFDADLAATGTSTCNGQCAVNWPPLTPPAGVALTTGFATIKRTDGTTQLTFDGRPQYMFAGDSAAGQANGDGLDAFGGLWHVSRPAGSTVGTSPNPPTNPY